MKKLVLLFSITLSVCFVAQNAQAQLSKKEKKEWKKKLKRVSPEQYKQLTEDYAKLKANADQADSKLASLENEVASRDSKIMEMTTELRDKDAEISSIKEKLSTFETAQAAAPVKAGTAPGVVFKVQIGAFTNKDLSKYFDKSSNFSGETDSDGTQKFTLGNFTDYWEADTFKKYLREMGVKDAWIVPYKDGERVAIKDVLEGAI
ncbi:Ezrin/radixin/moesin family protein [Persicobacter psychrovividus]|uniref:Ezrin/radixin/moesin family protein n=1 Tax=Persicobacter psychrovividus TaxID=387638 RepID=A0ABN6L4Q8_9BACT|nr:hypothetical protein PEPS_03710 [Persicobacter psychrovividus]